MRLNSPIGKRHIDVERRNAEILFLKFTPNAPLLCLVIRYQCQFAAIIHFSGISYLLV